MKKCERDVYMKKIIICCCLCALITAVTGCTGTADKLNEATEKIDKLSEKIDELNDIIDEQGNYYDNDYGYDEIHEIYDDTAVVEAYKSGDSSNLNKEDKYVLEQASKAINDIIKDGMTDYEKEKAVYDYMFDIVQFDESSLAAIDLSGENAHTPYGFFHDRCTICVGNATTFKLFMDLLGIDNKIIHSTEDGEHAWNVVKIDGDWYHVDITFDGGIKEPTYAYFNVTDEMKGSEYSWNKSEIPECTATKYSYPVIHAAKLKSVYEIPSAIKKALDSEKEVIYVKIPVPENSNAKVFTYQVDDLFNMMESEKYYIEAASSVAADNGKSIMVTVLLSNSDYGNYANYFDSESIDYSKLSDAFDSIFDGEITFNSEY